MPPLTREELADVLGAADDGAIAGFVADLEAARGRHVERDVGDADGDALAFAVGTGDDRRLVAVGGDNEAAADVVVAVGGNEDPPAEADALDAEAEVDVRDAGDLVDALLYAVDRETAERLLERWFDRSLDGFEGASGTATAQPEGGTTTARPVGDTEPDGRAAERAVEPPAQRAGAADTADQRADGVDDDDDGWGGLRTRATVVVVALALVAVALAGAWPGGPSSSPDVVWLEETATAGEEWDPFEPAEEVAYTTRPKVGAREPTPTPPADATVELPPGVATSGAIDEATLLDAHEGVLRNHSYRVTLTYREFINGSETGALVQTIRVENATTYLVSTTRLGTFLQGPVTFATGDSYADGTTRYERLGDGVRTEPTVGVDQFLEEQVRFLRYYLSVQDSRIENVRTVDGTTTVRLSMRGDSWDDAANASGTVVVTEDGVVRSLRRVHDVPDSQVRVVVTVRVADVGRTNVSAPPWVPRE